MIMIITVNDYSENMKLFLFHSKVGKTQHFSYVSRIQRVLWCFPFRENYVISPFLFPNKKVLQFLVALLLLLLIHRFFCSFYTPWVKRFRILTIHSNP